MTSRDLVPKAVLALLPVPAPAESVEQGRPYLPERAFPWGAAWAFWTIIAVLLAHSHYTGKVTAGIETTFATQLALNVLDMYPWIPITVAVFALSLRFPLDQRPVAPTAVVHLALGGALMLAKIVSYHYIGEALGLVRPASSLLLVIERCLGHITMVYVLVLGVAHAWAYYHRVRDRELRQLQLQRALVQAELQMLKMQLQPHFLFNTLNSISALTEREPRRASEMIGNLGRLLRGTLARQETQEVPLSEEIASLTPYLEIEQVRFGDRLQIQLQICPETTTARVPHMLLQPLVENAIRHGIAPRGGPGKVKITTWRRGAQLVLEVRDDGRGITRPLRRGAIGLANVQARLEHLYGDDHVFSIDSVSSRGTQVHIAIPFCRGQADRPEGICEE